MLRMFAIVCLLAAPWSLAGGGDGKLDRATLKGLRAFSVAVDPPGEILERQGVSADTLQTQVEQRLLQAGIAVDRNAVEFLGLRVAADQVKKGPVAFGGSLGLYQAVVLSRDVDTRTVTETWGTSNIALLQAKGLNRSVIEAVDQLVERFVNAYRSANPR